MVGSSIALHLAQLAQNLRVAVIERDSTYEWASAPRSAGGIRQQFSLPVNIKLSMYGIDFLRTGLQEMCANVDVDTDVQLRENGYLILASPGGGEAQLRANVAVQHATGATWIKLLEPEALKQRFPWLSTEGIALGAFGEKNEGYFDPWAMLQAMRKGAEAMGVEYVKQDVVGLDRGADGTISAVRLGDGASIVAGNVVNAAGAFGGHIIDLCGPGVMPLPVKPRKRCMWLFKAGEEFADDGVTPRPPDNTPLTVDPKGVYFRSEGTGARFVCGVAPEEDPDITLEDLRQPDEDLFEELIWPTLAERAPALESLKAESSWAGFYEYNTVDQNGVVGRHPDVPNLFVASGFSGHGLQHAPGVGRGIAELLVHGSYQSLDLSPLGYDRLVEGRPMLELCCY